MKRYIMFLLFSVFPVCGDAGEYLNASTNRGVVDVYAVDSYKKEHQVASIPGVVSSSIIRTDYYTKDYLARSNMRAYREMMLSSIQLSITRKLSVTDWVSLYGRAGLYNYQIEAIMRRHSLQNNPSFLWGNAGKETGPIASIGVEVKPFHYFTLHAEYQKTGRMTESSVSILYKF